MERLGEKFKQARLAKRVTIDQAAEETYIPKDRLEALEAENFDKEKFPAETYLIGFIRNYAIYLGLNSDEMIGLYRSHLIQEQPIPVQELLSPKKGPAVNWKIVGGSFLVVLIAVAVAVAGYFIATREKAAPMPEDVNASVPLFDTRFMEQRMNTGDKLRFPVADSQFVLTVKETAEKAVFEYESGLTKESESVAIGTEEEKLIDFDKNGIPDVKIFVRSIDADRGSVLVRFDREVGESVTVVRPQDEAAAPEESAFMDVAEEPVVPTGGARRVESTVVKTSSVANPFSIDIVFRQRCFVRYKLDTEDEAVEGFFRGNQRLRLDGNMKIYLSLSNAGVASVKVDGVDVQLGTLGQLVSREVQWAYNQQKRIYELRIIPRY